MENIAYGLVTASLTVAGGIWVASRPRVWLTEQRLALMVAIGGGVLAAALCFEMLPEAVSHGGPNAFFWLFAGLATVVLFERYLTPHLNFLGVAPAATQDVLDVHEHQHHAPHAHHHGGPCGHDHGAQTHAHAHHDHAHGGHLLSHGSACSALGCLLVCTFFDGIALTAGFAISPQVGIVLGIGLLLHLLPEGIVAATVVLAAGSSQTVARQAAVAIGASLMLGVGVASLLGTMLGFMGAALPFAAGVIMYVVLAQLLPVAMRTSAGVPVFLGVAMAFGLLERLLPHTH